LNVTGRNAQLGRRSRAGGFTLLEILIAISIFAVIALILYRSFSSVLNSTGRVRTEREQLRIADFLVTNFEKNISGAYLASPGVGMRTAAFVGEDIDIDGRSADMLVFYTNAERMAGGALPGDTKRVIYSLQEVADGFYAFTVREEPRLLLSTGGGEEGAKPRRALWTVPMSTLDFKYFDGAEFHDSWNSTQMGRLPCAVQIEAHFLPKELEWAMEEGGVKPVLTMVVSIPLGLSERVGGA
jgi:prepilin-type N-terminal cleavage/methylation domain-containing protein